MSLRKYFHIRNNIYRCNETNSLLRCLVGRRVSILMLLIVLLVIQAHTVYSQQVEQSGSAVRDISLTAPDDTQSSNIMVIEPLSLSQSNVVTGEIIRCDVNQDGKLTCVDAGAKL